MTTAIWLLLVQASLGAFDTLYYHEYKLRLPHGTHTAVELRLHAARDFAYAIIIGTLGFMTWNGAFAWIRRVPPAATRRGCRLNFQISKGGDARWLAVGSP